MERAKRAIVSPRANADLEALPPEKLVNAIRHARVHEGDARERRARRIHAILAFIAVASRGLPR